MKSIEYKFNLQQQQEHLLKMKLGYRPVTPPYWCSMFNHLTNVISNSITHLRSPSLLRNKIHQWSNNFMIFYYDTDIRSLLPSSYTLDCNEKMNKSTNRSQNLRCCHQSFLAVADTEREGRRTWGMPPPRSPCKVGGRVDQGERTSAYMVSSHKELNVANA